MLKCNVGSSTATDARIAGKEAASKAKAGLTDIKLLLAYASVVYDLDKMLEGIAEELPNVPVLGNTSYTGVVTPEGFVDGGGSFVGIMAFAGDGLAVGIAGSGKIGKKFAKIGLEADEAVDAMLGGDGRQTGRNVALEAMRNAGRTTAPDFYYMAASPGKEEHYIKGITNVVGRVPMFGGSAADNSISGEWKLYTNNGSFADGVVVAFFYGISMANIFTGAYRETADVGVITKVRDKRVLMEIDGVPALKKYAEWAGVDPEKIKGGDLLVYTINSPLGVKDRLGDLTAIRHPMKGNDDYSMNLGADVAEKTAVIRMAATQNELIESASRTLDELITKMGGCAAGYHLVHCGGRRAGIGDRIGEVAAAVKKVAGDVPFIMEFTFGEYGYEDDGSNTTGGLMLSYTGFKK